MTDIDKVLRDSLNRLAVPADPTGVAEAIQARVDAGDTGTPGSTRGGGGFGGLPPWAPWLGLIVVTGLVGGVLGVLGGLGAFGPHGSTEPSHAAARVQTVASPTVGTASPALTPSATPSTTPTRSNPSTKPTPPKTKPAPRDTTPPTLGTPTADHGTTSDPVCVNEPFDPAREKATITVPASDNRGVTAVSISWSGPSSDHGAGAMTRSGSVWKYVYDPAPTASTGTVSLTMQARDAAGNMSAVNKIDLSQMGCVD